MTQCKTAVTPLLMHWSYCSFAVSHWDVVCISNLTFSGGCRNHDFYQMKYQFPCAFDIWKWTTCLWIQVVQRPKQVRFHMQTNYNVETWSVQFWLESVISWHVYENVDLEATHAAYWMFAIIVEWLSNITSIKSWFSNVFMCPKTKSSTMARCLFSTMPLHKSTKTCHQKSQLKNIQ